MRLIVSWSTNSTSQQTESSVSTEKQQTESSAETEKSSRKRKELVSNTTKFNAIQESEQSLNQNTLKQGLVVETRGGFNGRF